MYNFIGQNCSVCHKPFAEGDDYVICPDCGAPYHRSCYQQAGACLYAGQHGSFEWQPPKPAAQQDASQAKDAACPRCGQGVAAADHFCKNCGFDLKAAPNYGRQQEASNFRQEYEAYKKEMYARDPFTLKPDEELDGISGRDWASYVGPANEKYLRLFKFMKLTGRKFNLSLSALIFGPFYFVYRKAWKPALLFGLLELLLEIPTIIFVAVISGNTAFSGLSESFLEQMLTISGILSWLVLMWRGSYGIYFYKRSAEHSIRRICSAFPDSDKRRPVLAAQGGTSMLFAVLAMVVFVVLLGLVTLWIAGPNMDAVIQYFYG